MSSRTRGVAHSPLRCLTNCVKQIYDGLFSRSIGDFGIINSVDDQIFQGFPRNIELFIAKADAFYYYVTIIAESASIKLAVCIQAERLNFKK